MRAGLAKAGSMGSPLIACPTNFETYLPSNPAQGDLWSKAKCGKRVASAEDAVPPVHQAARRRSLIRKALQVPCHLARKREITSIEAFNLVD